MTNDLTNKIHNIFTNNNLPLFIIPYNIVAKSSKNDKNYKTVLMTYIPYFYGRKQNQTVCLYAGLPDYHKQFSKTLTPLKEELMEMFPDNIFDIYSDNSPINEKKAAAISALGVVGRNSLIITEKYGSFIFLGEIITDISLDCETKEPQYCENCGNCEKNCPSKAIKDGEVDITRCISALTQKKGELTKEEAEFIGKNGNIWGCDTCQTACPHNKKLETSVFATESEILPFVSAEDLDGMSDEDFRKKYSHKSYVWRGVETLRRNISIVEKYNQFRGEKNG